MSKAVEVSIVRVLYRARSAKRWKDRDVRAKAHSVVRESLNWTMSWYASSGSRIHERHNNAVPEASWRELWVKCPRRGVSAYCAMLEIKRIIEVRSDAPEASRQSWSCMRKTA